LANFLDGPGRDVDEILKEDPPTANLSRTKQAMAGILHQLDQASELESEALTAETASKHGLSAGSVKNAKTRLKKSGLIRFVPVKHARSNNGTSGALAWQSRTTCNTPSTHSLARSHNLTAISQITTSPQAQNMYDGE